MEEEKIYSVTEPVGSEQDAPVSNMEMLSDVFFKAVSYTHLTLPTKLEV